MGHEAIGAGGAVADRGNPLSMAQPSPPGVRLSKVSAVFHHPERGALPAVNEVDLDVEPGELMTLLGPSGCGKTTTLRMVAGFQKPSSGRIFIGERDVTNVPANGRDIGFVFQNYALFPHMNIFENVAYGLRVRRKTKAEIRESVTAVLALVGLTGHGDRSPAELSGGQQQRVALARAIVIEPRVLLFDEPLSNLDATLRVEMRGEIQSLQKRLGITTLYVTHDQEEAMAISDRIAVMKDGRIAQMGTAADLYLRPASTFVAGFIGRANILAGTVLRSDEGTVELDISGQRMRFASDRRYAAGTRVSAVVRPEAIAIGTTGSGVKARLESRVYLGDKMEFTLRLGDRLLHATRSNPSEATPFALGQDIDIDLPGDAVHLIESDG
jgi:ABC-type Fe3+/spermidine/putrescine transport system ATPase subunit